MPVSEDTPGSGASAAAQPPVIDSDVRGKVPPYEKAAWAAGGASDAVMTTTIGMFALPVYNMGLGLPAPLVGWAIAIPRLLDAILDPIMGNISDNTRTRWGRRRPYIFIGGILVTILYWLTWCPPKAWSPTWIFVYFILISSLFFLAYTVYLIPHAALGFELSGDYNERTRVMAYRSFFGSIGGLFLPYFLLWSKSPLFGGNTVDGIRWVTAIAGGVMMLAILSTAIFCKERVSAWKQDKIGLWPALKYTMTNGPYVIIIGTVMLVIVACFLVNPLEIYVLTYYTARGDDKLGAQLFGDCNFIYGIIGLIMTVVLTVVATRIGKKTTLLLGELLALVSFLLTLYFYNPNLPYYSLKLPFLETPLILHPLLFVKLILNPGLTSVWILGFSMIADVCDVDEMKSGLRREGMFGAMYNTIVIKVGISLVTVLSGYAIAWSGYMPKVEPTPDVVTNLRYMYAFVPAVLLGLAFILTLTYPLTERKMCEVRRLLAERKLARAAI
ncbi:MAG: MFS transporter [bacterium]|nr:MFS transporter [Candidatus Sumerlaeota bacterium]